MRLLSRPFLLGNFLMALSITTLVRAEQIPLYLGTNGPAGLFGTFDLATGTLGPLTPLPALTNSAWIVADPARNRLQVLSEVSTGQIGTFSIDARQVVTAPATFAATGGGFPTHAALAPNGRTLALAHYTGGAVASFALNSDGTLGARVSLLSQTHFSNVNPARQEAPHPHGAHFTPDGAILLVPDLGADRVYIYQVNATTSALTAHPTQPYLTVPPGSGPRHGAFSPDGAQFYVANELTNTVSTFAYAPSNATTPFTSLGAPVSTLPAGTTVTNTVAEIAVHPAGHTVYVSNRGHESLAVFDRAASTGALTIRRHVPCGGVQPRHFTLSPDARWLLCAHQQSQSLTVFNVATDGNLTALHTVSGLASKPSCVVLERFPFLTTSLVCAQ
jgi:6-phosphogluconolactonase